MSIEIIKWKPAKRTKVDEDIFVELVNTFLKMINSDQKWFKNNQKIILKKNTAMHYLRLNKLLMEIRHSK